MVRYYIDGKRISAKDFKNKIADKAFMKKYHHFSMVADKFLPFHHGFTLEKWLRYLVPSKKKRKKK